MSTLLELALFESYSLNDEYNKYYEEEPAHEVLEKMTSSDNDDVSIGFLSEKNYKVDLEIDAMKEDCFLKAIRHHDCMWTGTCSSADHKHSDSNSYPFSTSKRQNLVSISSSTTSNSRRSLLINSKVNQLNSNGTNGISHINLGTCGNTNTMPNKNVSSSKYDQSFSKILDTLDLNGRPETPPHTSDDAILDVVGYITNEKQKILQMISETLESTDFNNSHESSAHVMDSTFNDQLNYDEDSCDSLQSAAASSAESSSDEGDDSSQNWSEIDADVCQRSVRTTESDHCYHLSQEPPMALSSRRLESLGVDTPSDSEEEEEIDVVSVYSETQQNHHHYNNQNHQFAQTAISTTRNNQRGTPLPTNPSATDRQSLQRSMEFAMKNNKRTASNQNSVGIKTRLPLSAVHNNNSRAKETTMLSPPPKTMPSSIRAPKKRSSSMMSSQSDSSSSRGVKRARQSCTTPSSSSKQRTTRIFGSSESESEEKRNLHNDMERMRRVDLKNAFNNLRTLVPSVSNKDRAAKVNVLRASADYCLAITRHEQTLTQTKAELKMEQIRLKSRVSFLRRLLASKR